MIIYIDDNYSLRTFEDNFFIKYFLNVCIIKILCRTHMTRVIKHQLMPRHKSDWKDIGCSEKKVKYEL